MLVNDVYDSHQTLVDHSDVKRIKDFVKYVSWSLDDLSYVNSSPCSKRSYLDPFFPYRRCWFYCWTRASTPLDHLVMNFLYI